MEATHAHQQHAQQHKQRRWRSERLWLQRFWLHMFRYMVSVYGYICFATWFRTYVSLHGQRFSLHGNLLSLRVHAATRPLFYLHIQRTHIMAQTSIFKGAARNCLDVSVRLSRWLIMSQIDFAKNQENYFVVKVDGEVVEDFDGLIRPLWRCHEKECPFPGCSENAWNRVKKDLWSVESEDHVRTYIKQHGVESVLHGRKKDNPIPEDKIDSIVRDVEIHMSDDTWSDRQEYKTERDRVEQGRKRKKEMQDDKDQWHDDQWHDSAGSSSSNWQRETGSQKAILQSLATLSHNVGMLAAGKAAPPAITAGPSSSEHPVQAASRAVPAFIDAAMRDAATLDNGAVLSVNEKMVSVPFSTLMLCKETTTRSKEACKQALASMLTPMNQLRIELGVLSNTESVLDQIIESAKNS